MTPTDSPEIREALDSVSFHDTGKGLIRLDLVRDIRRRGGEVEIVLNLPSPGYPNLGELTQHIRSMLSEIDGIEQVHVQTGWTVRTSSTKKPPLPGIKNVLAVGSGKGGVGKSAVASNLALGLAGAGAAVGFLDLDIYGPSGTVALGSSEAPEAEKGDRLVPSLVQGVRFLSMGQLVPGDKPVVWRGPMLHKMVQQFTHASWGELDYLVLDLPPGTGDVQLTVTQEIPVAGAVVVTTPQEIALLDARKGLRMFRDNGIPILGIVENMAWYDCRKCDERHYVFGDGGGRRLAEEQDVALLGQLPLDPAAREAGDAGRPIVTTDTRAGQAFRELAFRVAAEVGARSLQKNPFRVLS